MAHGNTNRMVPQVRRIDGKDLHLYYHHNGDDTMLIMLEAIMDQDVDGDALSQAVRDAERRYTAFGCGLATTGRGLCYRSLETTARAFEDVPGKRWLLGTEDTAGRLYRVTYDGPRITVSLHHGLTDGRGAFEYLKTLLYYYLVALGNSVDACGKVLLAGDVPQNEDEYPCLKYGKRIDQGNATAPGATQLFGIDEDYLDEHGEYLCRHVELTAPADAVVLAARNAQVTVTSLLIAAVDRAVGCAYHPKDEIVLCCVTTDLRPLFGTSTMQNFSGVSIIAEVPQMRSMPIETEAQALGQQLATSHNKDAALGKLSEHLEEMERLETTPVDELFGNEDALMMEKRGVRSKLASLLTNVGVVDLPSDVQQHVRQASFRIPSFSATMSIAVATCGDTLTLQVTHPFKNEAFSHALAETLTQLGIPTRLSDRGLEAYDILGREAVVDLT
ncbi:MAG: hypothetical protein Q4A01_07740 [Coriobacteriales bacterium]|nr:hypothetical protein [Coriobacteriales bacterium]